jgi:glycosyltransferase involved in cell wall biosynthesis
MTDGTVPATAIVLTCNEAANIGRCLQAMRAIDDVVIVDSLSTDDTLRIARRVRPDVRVLSNPFRDFGDQRNWALDHAGSRHDWVLFVDADEYCTPELLDEIAGFVGSPSGHVGAYIAGRTEFLGRWIRHCTIYPSYQLRLLRRGEVRFRKEGHGQKEVTGGRLAYLREGWLHNAFSKGLHQWIERHNRYSTDETGLIRRLRGEAIVWSDLWGRDPVRRRRCLKRLGARVPLRPWVRFLYVYLWRRGFLDGRAGLIFCLLRLAHDIHIMAKLAEDDYRRERADVGSLARPRELT